MVKILVCDDISDKGLDILRADSEIELVVKTKQTPEQLISLVSDVDGILVRSQTKITADIINAAKKLRAVGRAGAGVDNIDIDIATGKGIVVMNTPGGNTLSAAEHTIAMLLALARNIPQAYAALKNKEWNRKKYTGTEVNGKTLGVVGLGRVGREVARMAHGLGMVVIASDPFVTPENASAAGAILKEFDELLGESDYISLNLSLTPQTRHLFNREAFAKMKNGVRLINCARGGLVDTNALIDALKSGKVHAASVDVFEKEPPLDNPLLEIDNVIVTPHLGASTVEAQEKVAVAIAEQFLRFFKQGVIQNAVNVPMLDEQEELVLVPYITLGEKIGLLLAQLFPGPVREITIQYSGEITNYDLSLPTVAVQKGLLMPVLDGQDVNIVNTPKLIRERGIKITETRSNAPAKFTNLVVASIDGGRQGASVSGTVGVGSELRIVRIGDFEVDWSPEGVTLFCHNEDKPGFIGQVGTILGKYGVNIASMEVSRRDKGGEALTIISLDSSIPEEVLAELRKIPQLKKVLQASL